MQKIYTANIIIKNNKEEILLIKRVFGKDEGGLWSLPGGTKEKNEKIIDTLHREVEEELGQKIEIYYFFKKYKVNFYDKIVVANYFFGKIGNPIKVRKEEILGHRWFSLKKIPENLAFSQNKVIDDFVKYQKILIFLLKMI